mmetsp:Transcript_20725/g.52223  ORF Transcript_20725/g.52223 Transcript_20725/m.52223 type:complete len:331 (+) Transcript_20725:2142-3134(+)
MLTQSTPTFTTYSGSHRESETVFDSVREAAYEVFRDVERVPRVGVVVPAGEGVARARLEPVPIPTVRDQELSQDHASDLLTEATADATSERHRAVHALLLVVPPVGIEHRGGRSGRRLLVRRSRCLSGLLAGHERARHSPTARTLHLPAQKRAGAFLFALAVLVVLDEHLGALLEARLAVPLHVPSDRPLEDREGVGTPHPLQDHLIRHLLGAGALFQPELGPDVGRRHNARGRLRELRWRDDFFSPVGVPIQNRFHAREHVREVDHGRDNHWLQHARQAVHVVPIEDVLVRHLLRRRPLHHLLRGGGHGSRTLLLVRGVVVLVIRICII